MRRFFLIIFISSVSARASVNWSELEALARQKSPEMAVKKILEISESGPLEPKTLFLLQKVADKIFDTFYTEKGLNYFEVGKHLAISNPKEAIITLQKGMEQEPYNGKIFLLWARVSLSLGKCGFAERTKKLTGIYPHIYELHLIVAQDLACQEKEQELAEWLEKNSGLPLKFKKHLTHLAVRLAWIQKDQEKVESNLDELEAVDSQFTEINFWRSKLEKVAAEKKQEFVDKYLATCSNMSEKAKREHLIEPLTCGGVRELKESKTNG
jgi:hypothetical protein